MASFNKVILVGNLTRDPELRYIPSGMAVTDIGLAVNDRRKGQNGEWIDEVTFVDITLWGRNAEVVSEYCAKGKPLLVEGRLKLDMWENEGQKKSKLKVIGEKVQLLGAKDGAGNAGGEGYSKPSGGAKSQQSYRNDDAYDQSPPMDDVPF